MSWNARGEPFSVSRPHLLMIFHVVMGDPNSMEDSTRKWRHACKKFLVTCVRFICKVTQSPWQTPVASNALWTVYLSARSGSFICNVQTVVTLLKKSTHACTNTYACYIFWQDSIQFLKCFTQYMTGFSRVLIFHLPWQPVGKLYRLSPNWQVSSLLRIKRGETFRALGQFFHILLTLLNTGKGKRTGGGG
jgi:hypothetical protein